ncbi:helix-hairpin-helix domain-containing protein [Sporosarcina siberiensis]|uniref:Helix-hairpin-helix domain-containing protein n=1 Tax=Sporosarcina siberiensis TaxID=1365606 RepID=A0ABW4SDK7_9BACL
MPLVERVTVLNVPFVTRNWRKFLIPIAAITAIIAFLLFPREQSDSASIVMSNQNPFPELVETLQEEPLLLEQPSQIIVDVKGAVRYPGVYTMQDGDRLITAITAAGGYLPNADSRNLNHAMKLLDEFVIYVPLEGEEILEVEQSLVSGPVGQTNDHTININTSDEAQLMTIPGIGPAKAAAIIAYRNEHGLFKDTTDLMNISGIGQKTFEKLEHLIKVK